MKNAIWIVMWLVGAGCSAPAESCGTNPTDAGAADGGGGGSCARTVPVRTAACLACLERQCCAEMTACFDDVTCYNCIRSGNYANCAGRPSATGLITCAVYQSCPCNGSFPGSL